MSDAGVATSDRPGFLDVREISKQYPGVLAVDGASMSVGAGERIGLVGKNGAGKSTLMKVLAGAVTPDAGEMFLDGQPYRPRSTLDARRSGVAMIYQELSLALHLSVEENILLGMEQRYLEFGMPGVVRWGGRTGAAHLSTLFNARNGEARPPLLFGGSQDNGLYARQAFAAVGVS